MQISRLDLRVCFAAAVLFVPGVAASAADQKAVTKVVLAGSGCAASNVGQGSLENGGDTLVVKTPALEAKSLAATKKLVRLNCEAAVSLAHAANLKPVVESLSFTRFGKLASGARATVTGKFHYQGGADTPSATVKFEQAGDIAALKETLALPSADAKCEKETTISASIAVILFGSGAGDSSLTVNDGIELGLKWLPCP